MKKKTYKQSTLVKNSIDYPLDKLRAKGHTFFNLDSVLNIDQHLKQGVEENVNVFIINLEKNVGKTYWMREKMNSLVEECLNNIVKGKLQSSMFLWVFRNDEAMKGRKSEINTDPLWDFYIRSGELLTKGTLIGVDKKGRQIFKDRGIKVGEWLGFHTMHNASSNAYNGYTDLFFDEYRSKKPLPLSQASKEVNNFITLLSNFQRDKLKATVYLFGNNEPGADLIAESLGIQKNMPYYIDFVRGVFYLNSAGAFKGRISDNNIAKKFAVGNTQMDDFLTSNISMESHKGITERNKFLKAVPWAYLMMGNTFFKISIYQEKEWLVQNVQELDWIRDPDLISFAYLTEDLVHSSRLVPIDEDILRMFADLYRNDMLLFWQGGAKQQFSILWTKILKKNNLYQ